MLSEKILSSRILSDIRLVIAHEDDIAFAGKIISSNMACYYQGYALKWNFDKFIANWCELENYIIKDGFMSVGLISLSFDMDTIYIQDIQITPMYQCKGIGTWGLKLVEEMAVERGFAILRLRVFKSKPTRKLYQRIGYNVVIEEENSLGMETILD